MSLINYSEKLSNLEFFGSKNYDDIPDSVKSISFDDPYLSPPLKSNTLDLMITWRSGKTINTQNLNELRKLLDRNIESVIQAKSFPTFFLRNILKLSELKRQMVILSLYSDKNKCLPSEWKYVYLIDFTGQFNQVVIRYDPSNYPAINNPNKYELRLNPDDLELGGIAWSFWVNIDITKLPDNYKVLTGLRDGIESLTYTISKVEGFKVNHSIVFNNVKKDFVSDSKCVEKVFIMIHFKKDCDKYRILLTFRSPGSSRGFVWNQEIDSASYIEKLYLTLSNTNNVEISNIVQNYKYFNNINNELSIMNCNRPDNVKNCDSPSIGCNYSCLDGSCCACDSNSYLMTSEKKCYQTCPDGFIGRRGICYPCHFTCKTCSGELSYQCLTCNSNSNYPSLFKNECRQCPDDTFPNVTNNNSVCVDCNEPFRCEKCSSSVNCPKCKMNYFLMSNKCKEMCDPGYFKNYQQRTCDRCLDHCNSCRSAYDCTGCEPNYFFKEDKACVTDCGDYYYKNTRTMTCDRCRQGCKKCEFGTGCDCEYGVYNEVEKKCPLRCIPPLYFYLNTCSPCKDSNCLECKDDLDYCTYCKYPSYAKDGMCTTLPSDCGPYYYYDEIKRNCLRCTFPYCLKCDREKCLECPNNTYMLGNYCYPSCPHGYVAIGKYCEKCTNPNCKRCLASNKDSCVKCFNPKILYNEQCIDRCPDGFYPARYRKCEMCMEGCKRCANPYICDECLDNYWAMNGKGGVCYLNCPENYTKYYSNGVKICTIGYDVYCSVYKEISLEECIKCRYGYYLYNNRCYEKCPLRTYKVIGNDGTLSCSICSDYYCVYCTNGYDCVKCEPGKKLYNNKCISECLDGFIEIDGECIPCTNTDCKRCYYKNLDFCIECKMTAPYLYNQTCVKICPDKYYREGTSCLPCQAPCLNCKSRDQCDSCIDGFKYQPQTGICKPDCDIYKGEMNGKCLPCIDRGCPICSKNNIQECLRCENPYFLYNGDCLFNCPEGMLGIFNICIECPRNSISCRYPNIVERCVYSERNPKYLYNGECIDKCPDRMYADNKRECKSCLNNKCENCDPNNPSYCIFCQIGMYLINGNCDYSCPFGYWKDDYRRKCNGKLINNFSMLSK